MRGGLRCLTGAATISISRCLLFVLFCLHFNIFLLQPSSLLSRGSPSHLPLCILLLIGFLKLSLFLQTGIHILEYSAFWNPFIPIFIPTIVMDEVFDLFILYGNFYTLCFIKKRPMKAQHSLTSWNLGFGSCFSTMYKRFVAAISSCYFLR